MSRKLRLDPDVRKAISYEYGLSDAEIEDAENHCDGKFHHTFMNGQGELAGLYNLEFRPLVGEPFTVGLPVIYFKEVEE